MDLKTKDFWIDKFKTLGWGFRDLGLGIRRLGDLEIISNWDLSIKQSGDIEIWRISPNLEKLQISKLEKSSKFGEMAIFQSCFWEGRSVLNML